MPAWGEGGGASDGVVGEGCGADGEGGCRGAGGEVEAEFCLVAFWFVGIGYGEGGGFHFGGVVEGAGVEEGGVLVDEFDGAGTVAVGDEVEVIGSVAVGESADGFDGAFGVPAMPGVDVVVGVVGHEGEGAIHQGEDGDAEGFSHDGAACDAAPLGEDVVSEDGEVLRGEGVLGVVVGELVEAAGATLTVEEAVCSGDSGDVGGADAAMVDDAGGGGSEGGSGAGLEYPLAVFCAELDG